MAKATAKCKCEKCGQTFYKDVYGFNRSKADSKAKWAAENFTLCPDCYRADKAEKEKAKYAWLPELEGSEKQVAWANDIRKNVLSYIETHCRDTRYSACYKYAISKITSAKLYIDTRSDPKDFLNCDECFELGRDYAREHYPESAL